MRTVLLSLISLCVLGGLFFWLVWKPAGDAPANLIASTSVEQPIDLEKTIEQPQDDAPLIGAGSDAWVQEIDPKTGQLKNEFRAKRYEPMRDGSIQISQPEARFFMNNGRVLEVRADSCVAQTGIDPDQEQFDQIRPTLPERGTMTNVVISLLAQAGGEKILTCELPSVSFDSVTFRIFTADTQINGIFTPAERIPIRMRGRDYDFDGYGLTAQWNQVQDRLELLQIARGERLIAKNTQSIMPVALRRQPAPANVFAMQALPQSQEQTPTQAYDAQFSGQVEVFENDQKIATSDELTALLTLDFNEQTQPVDEAASSSSTVDRPSPSRPRREQVDAAETPPPSDAPTTIELRWSGPLRVTPSVLKPMITPDEQSITLKGTPLVVQRDETKLTCGSLSIEPSLGRLVALPVEGGIVTLLDPQGTKLTTPRLEADQSSGISKLAGPGNASIPATLGTDESTTDKPTIVKWSEQAILRFDPASESPTLDGIDLVGDVLLDAPDLTLSAGQVMLRRDPDAAQIASSPQSQTETQFDVSQLRQIVASENVSATIVETGVARSIQAQKLDARLSNAEQPSIEFLSASGDVRFADTEFDLSAQSVKLKPTNREIDDTLTPLQRFEAQLEIFEASGKVAFKSKDGLSAKADMMKLVRDGELPAVLQVSGEPAELDTGDGALVGPDIQMVAATGDVIMNAPGTIASTRPDGTSVSVSWGRSLQLDREANLARIDGGLDIRIADSQGRVVLGSADSAEMALSQTSSNEPTDLRATRIELIDKVRFESAPDSTGDRVSMRTPRLSIDLANDKITAPGAGKLVLMAADETQTTIAPADSSDREARGNAAVAWTESLIWDTAKGQLDVTGNVAAAFEQLGDDPRITRLYCDQITAQTTPFNLPDESSNDDPIDDELQIKLNTAQARGAVRVRSDEIEFDSERLEFDAQTQLVTARAREGEAVVVYEKGGASGMSFGGIVWNLQTGDIEQLIDLDVRARR